MKYLGNIFLGVIMGMAAMFFMGRGCKHKNAEHAAEVAKRDETNVIAALRQAKDDTIQYYRDAFGHEHADKVLAQGDLAAVKIFYKPKLDSVCKALKIRDRQLSSMTDVVSRINGSFTTQTQTVGEQDTTGVMPQGWHGLAFTWQDKFLREQGFVDSNATTVYYQMQLPVSVTTYWTRRWFLGKKRFFIDATSVNPNVHITGLTGITITKK